MKGINFKESIILRLIKLLLVVLILFIMFFVTFTSQVQAQDKVTLLFFDRNGTPLNVAQTRSVSNNGSAGFDNDILLNPNTLEVIADTPLVPSGSTLAFTVQSQPVAFALIWPTKPRGYSLLILDNGGAGFISAGIVNFTFRAALDIKRRLDAALVARLDYQPSAAFQTAYDAASTHIDIANKSTEESVKGAEGQLALDQLALAYDALLAEYGPVYAHANLNSQTPWIGVTISRVENYEANLDLATTLTNPYGWIRIVFDLDKTPADYEPLIRYAKKKGLKVLGQPIDSSYDKYFTRTQYRQRFIDYLTYYNGLNAPSLEGWELGNEVNGSWLTAEIPGKIEDAATEVRNRQPDAKTVLTLFWQINTNPKPFSMFNWVRANLPEATRQKIDVVFLSQYAEQAPMGLVFDQVMTAMQAEFPYQKIGVGELGYWVPNQRIWWAISESDPMGAGIRGTAAQYYPASFGYSSSVGGGFWWFFSRQFSADLQLQGILSSLRDQITLGTAAIRRDWLVDIRVLLQDKVLKFWTEHASDHEFDGVYGRLDRRGEQIEPGNKSLVLISRTLWSFAEAYRRYPLPEYKEIAMSCLHFLREQFYDKEHGGYYFMVSREGLPTETTKLVNPMCYMIEALAEAALAFHDELAAEEALDLFRVIDKAGHDSTYGGYRMAFTSDWKYIQNYQPGYAGPSPQYPGAFERKSFDWHLGLLEAFATLYDLTGDPVVRVRIEELLDLFTNKIIDVNRGYGRLWFTRDWQQYIPDETSHESEYGLDCEASWLIMESAKLVGRMNDPKICRMVLALTDHAIEVGFDKERGGVYNAGPVAGSVTNKTKSWWQQCEALVAFLNAYQMTGASKYRNAFEQQVRFIELNFVDHEYGEWYTSIGPEGKINTEKVGPWKAPYHVTRALLEIIGRLSRTL